MSSEREAIESKRPKCPHCGHPDPASLHDGPAQYNWQCSSLKCLKEFQTPRKVSIAAIVAEERRRRSMTVEEVAIMATDKDLKCSKCGKSYAHKKRLETHEADCSGEEKAKPARKSKALRKAKAPAAAKVTSNGDAIDGAVEGLKAKRLEIIAGIPELARIDSAIAALELLGGG